MPPHRKRNKSYNESGHAHALTFSCFHRSRLLSKDRTCRWFVDAMKSTRRRLFVWGDQDELERLTQKGADLLMELAESAMDAKSLQELGLEDGK